MAPGQAVGVVAKREAGVGEPFCIATSTCGVLLVTRDWVWLSGEGQMMELPRLGASSAGGDVGCGLPRIFATASATSV